MVGSTPSLRSTHCGVAQLVEHRAVNAVVAGSIPAAAATGHTMHMHTRLERTAFVVVFLAALIAMLPVLLIAWVRDWWDAKAR